MSDSCNFFMQKQYDLGVHMPVIIISAAAWDVLLVAAKLHQKTNITTQFISRRCTGHTACPCCSLAYDSSQADAHRRNGNILQTFYLCGFT